MMAVMIAMLCCIGFSSGNIPLGLVVIYSGLQVWALGLWIVHKFLGKYYQEVMVEYFESCL